MAFSEIKDVIRILMLGSPPGIEAEAVLNAMVAVEGVENVHHLHLWQISEAKVSLEAHVVLDAVYWPEHQAIKARVKAVLADTFGIDHVTLDIEAPGEECDHPSWIGSYSHP